MFARRFFRFPLALPLIGLTATSCEEVSAPVIESIPPVSQPVLVNLRWQHPFPQGNDLNRMWGFSDGSFYAVGDGGTVLHFDGTTWTLLDMPTREDLHGIWASGPGDVYVAGFGGTLIHYDGSQWTTRPTPTQADLYAVHVNPPGDVFITGLGGSVWNRFNGAWTEYPVAPGQRMQALLGYSHEEVYVCGSNASFHRFDGASWTPVPLGVNVSGDSEFRDMWGPGPGTYSVLVGQRFVWTDGTTWGALGEGNGRYAHGLWGASLDDQVMVAAGLSTHLIDGVDRTFATPSEEPLFDVWGPAKNDYYAVGRSGSIAHFDGAGWQALSRGPTSDLRDVWVLPTGAVAVGADGIVLHQDGSEWVTSNVVAGYDLSGVWQGDGVSVAVGRFAPNDRDWRQAVLMSTGGSWTDVGTIGSAHRFFDVWGSSSSDVYAVGWGGEIVHFDGDAWTVVDAGEGDAAFLASVSGTSSDNVIAVGRTNDLRGLVCRFDGTQWTKTTLTGIEELAGVWVASPSHAIAVGSFGAIRRFDGTSWSSMTSPTREALFCVWGSSPSDVYAAGWEGTLIHYDGSRWSILLPNTHRTIRSISGVSSGEVYFAGDRGAILRFDGM